MSRAFGSKEISPKKLSLLQYIEKRSFFFLQPSFLFERKINVRDYCIEILEKDGTQCHAHSRPAAGQRFLQLFSSKGAHRWDLDVCRSLFAL